jgi:hypothetical protein
MSPYDEKSLWLLGFLPPQLGWCQAVPSLITDV